MKYHGDHLGSTSLVTDNNGNELETTHYAPYGKILSGGDESRYSYEGKEYDSVSKTFDFHFRQYDPDNVIYDVPDSLLPNVYDPQQLNRYSFERGNPWKNVDETGHQGCITPGCSVEFTLMAVFPPLAIAGAAYLGYIGGTALREAYPPSQLTQDLSNAADYVYEYAYAKSIDAWARIAEGIEADMRKSDTIQKSYDLVNMAKKSLDEKDEETKDEETCVGCIEMKIKNQNGNEVGTVTIDNKGQGTITFAGSSDSDFKPEGGGTAFGGGPSYLEGWD